MREFGLKNLFSKFLDLLYPPKCAACSSVLPFDTEDTFCENCRKEWNREKGSQCRRCNQPIPECWCGVPGDHKDEINSERHLVQYDKRKRGVVKNVIYCAKSYDNSLTFDVIASEMASDFSHSYEGSNAIVIPIPRSPKTKRRIGHDQSKCIALRFCRITGLEYAELIEHTGSKKQKKLTQSERRENAAKSYKLINNAREIVKNRSVILIDDVVTTGSTVVHCAHILKRNGASNIIVFSIAKTV